MRRRFSLVGLIASGACFVVSAGAWYVLNEYRREYYISAVEGPSGATSPYWTIIRAQHFLVWPIFCLFGFATLMFLFEFAHFIAPKISKRNGGK